MPYVQNAPNMMIAPDLAAQQQQLQRQQQIADLLRSQAMQAPDPNQTAAGGVAIKQSPMQGIARLLTAYMAGKKQDDVDAKGLDIAKNYQGRLASLLGGEGGAPSAPNGDIPMVSTDDGSSPAPASASTSKGVNLGKYLKGMALGSMYGDDAAKAYYADEARTESQKNNAYLGIGTPEARALEIARRQKEAMHEAAPGSMTTNLLNGQKTFAPKVDNGITLDGQGNASAVPGYADANAGIVSAAEQAKAQAAAQFDMVKVDTPQGPVMMTRDQAVKQAGGVVPSPTQTAPVNFTASNGVKLDFTNTPFGQVAEQAMKSGDPAMLQAVQEYMGQKTAKPQGIALQTDAQKEQQVGQVKNNLEIERTRIQNAQSPEAQQKILDAQSVVDLAANAEKILAAGKATGSTVGTVRDKIQGAVGVSTQASQAAAQLKAIGGMMTSKMPKMSGPQSDKDVQQYKEMAGQIGDSSLPIKDRMAALAKVKELNQKYLNQNKGSIPEKAVEENRAGAGTPSVEDLLNHYLKGP
jgi:hypothetical protein